MSKWNISSLTGVDLEVARRPEIGAESLVKVSYDPIGLIRTVTQSAVGAGALATPAGAYAIPTDGLDLVLVTRNAVRSNGPLTVTLAVVDEDDSATTAVATLAAPSYSADSSNNFPIGIAMDLVPATGASKKIKSITSLTSVTNGAVGNEFGILALPASDRFFEVGCASEKDITLPMPSSVAVPCRYNGAQYVKSGRSEPGTLNCTAKYISFADGLARVAGQQVTALVESRKDNRVVTERLFLGGWRPVPQSPKGDGDDLVETSAEGIFENFAVFV